MSITLTTGQVISIADGRLACDIGDVYTALNAITGDNLFTHQLPRAARFVEPHLGEMHPWVRSLPPTPLLDGLSSDEKERAVYGWVAQISAAHGETHHAPDLSGQWIHLDAVYELSAIFGAKESNQ